MLCEAQCYAADTVGLLANVTLDRWTSHVTAIGQTHRAEHSSGLSGNIQCFNVLMLYLI